MHPEVATLYALIHRGTPGDRAFYRSVCAGGARVLELGVGAGRIALDLVSRGHFVCGLDREPALLDVARQEALDLGDEERERLRLVRGDMRQVNLDERFDRVIVPFNALCCLTDREALESCFTCVRAHLEPDGLFAFDIYRGDPETTIDDQEDHLVRLEHDGRTWDVYERALTHDDPLRADTRYRFAADDGTEHELVIEQRLLDDDEVRSALEASGLEVRSTAGSFSDEKLEDESPHLVVVATPS
jgi:SAM-dependent methyltransferase